MEAIDRVHGGYACVAVTAKALTLEQFYLVACGCRRHTSFVFLRAAADVTRRLFGCVRLQTSHVVCLVACDCRRHTSFVWLRAAADVTRRLFGCVRLQTSHVVCLVASGCRRHTSFRSGEGLYRDKHM